MKIRQDITELLKAGYSDRAIAARLGVDAKKTVRAAREHLGLPKAKPGYTAAASLEAAFQARVTAAAGGHLTWAGHRDITTPSFRWQNRKWTAYRAAFQIRYGRPPVGKVTPGCGVPDCVAPDHVEDRPMREALSTLHTAIFGSTR